MVNDVTINNNEIEDIFLQAHYYLVSMVKRNVLYSFIQKHPELIQYEDKSEGNLLNVATKFAYYEDVKELIKIGFSVNAQVIQTSLTNYYYNRVIYSEAYASVVKLGAVKEFITPLMTLSELKKARKNIHHIKKNFKYDRNYVLAFKQCGEFLKEKIQVLSEKNRLEKKLKHQKLCIYMI